MRGKLVVVALVLAALLMPMPAMAQANTDALAALILRVFGPEGLFVDSNFFHEAHFVSDFQEEFRQFNIALVSQLVSLPLPSSGSGFTYEFDESVGAFTRTAQSFGPIMAERAETIGRGKFSLSFAFQYFGFDEVEGISIDSVPAVFEHVPQVGADFEDDVITADNDIGATISQFTGFFTYGVTDQVDVSVAVPIVSTDLSVTSTATIQRITEANPNFHFFDDPQTTTTQFSESGSATGIGDVILRVKANPARTEHAAFAAGVDVRLPTGDEMDLLGSGAVGVKPFGVFAYRSGRFSPHANVAYLWNGDSVLAGNPLTGEEADLPDQFQFAVGVDVGVHPQLTVAADVLGSQVLDTARIVQSSVSTVDGQSFPTVIFPEDSFSILNLALGLKANPTRELLIDFNLLIKLNDSGLRDTVTPLIGVEYGF